MRLVTFLPILVFSIEENCVESQDYKRCEDFYTEVYYDCVSKCDEPSCSTNCNRELGSNLENCPCKVIWWGIFKILRIWFFSLDVRTVALVRFSSVLKTWIFLFWTRGQGRLLLYFSLIIIHNFVKQLCKIQQTKTPGGKQRRVNYARYRHSNWSKCRSICFLLDHS